MKETFGILPTGTMLIYLSKKYTEELLPTLYFSKQDGGDLGDAFTETPEIYDKKYGNFEALRQVRRTSDLKNK